MLASGDGFTGEKYGMLGRVVSGCGLFLLTLSGSGNACLRLDFVGGGCSGVFLCLGSSDLVVLCIEIRFVGSVTGVMTLVLSESSSSTVSGGRSEV